MKKYKAICFDMFFTLVNPRNELQYWEYEPAGVDPDEWNRVAWDPVEGEKRFRGEYETIDEIMDGMDKMFVKPLTKEQREGAVEGRRRRMETAICGIDEKIINVVKTLKERGYKIGLISNADAFDVEQWPKSPISKYFDDVVFSCAEHVGKPDRAIFERSLEHLGVNAEDAVFVGDGATNEHMAAKSVGFTTVWTEYLKKWDENLRLTISQSADYHITDFAELPDMFK